MSDASQSEWMLYVYKQFNMPTTATGVDVVLSVVDANGNFREIGTVQTDTSGTIQPTMDTRHIRQIHSHCIIRRLRRILRIIRSNSIRR